jgi:hypothetical protein
MGDNNCEIKCVSRAQYKRVSKRACKRVWLKRVELIERIEVIDCVVCVFSVGRKRFYGPIYVSPKVGA